MGFFVLFAAVGNTAQPLKQLELGWASSSNPCQIPLLPMRKLEKPELFEQVP